VPAFADLLVDGDFESASGDWTFFGNFSSEVLAAPGFTTAPPGFPGEGSASLMASGGFNNSNNVNGVYQDVAVDGSDFSVGDMIQVTGFAGIWPTDPITSTNVEGWLEISFFDPGGLEEFEIGVNLSAKIVDATPDDEWIALSTSMPIIPANAQFIRVKAVVLQRNFDNGVVYFDNLSLVKVIPEPGTFGLFALGTALLFFRSRRARA
jgi:hypothetical protein